MWFLFFSKLWSFLKLFPKYSFGVCLPISWCQDSIKLHCASQQSGDLLHQCLGANKNEAGPDNKGEETWWNQISSPLVVYLKTCSLWTFCLGVSIFLFSQLELSSGWLILVGTFFHCLCSGVENFRSERLPMKIGPSSLHHPQKLTSPTSAKQHP